MNPRALILVAGLGAVAALRAQTAVGPESSEPPAIKIGPLPSERAATLVESGERNTFARRESHSEAARVVDEETEESKIRAILQKLPVTGVTRGADGVKVLLGSLILRAGVVLPPLISGQTEVLTVSSVKTDHAEITFLERSEQTAPRTITIPFDLTPRVSVALEAEPKATPAPAADKPTSMTTIRATPLDASGNPQPPPIADAPPDGP